MTATPAWSSRDRVLLLNGVIYSPTSPFATAMLVDGGTVAWLGEDPAAHAYRDAADTVVDLQGRLVAPGFVDAHVHATSTGLALTGLDLSGTSSLTEALDLVSARARLLRGGVILGHGWDETRWPEGRAPSRTELDRATWGSVAYLSRIDVHSALASSALLAVVPGIEALPGYSEEGPVSREAHHAVRETALASIPASQRQAAQRAMRDHAGRLGIVALHEMAGPAISGEHDLVEVLALGRDEPGPLVAGYWGQLAEDGGVQRARELGALGAAGDLFADGAIGSRTACLSSPYDDDPATSGAAYLSASQVADHVVAATEAGMQAGFHVIGDAATRSVITGFVDAAGRIGVETVRAAGHRLEHAEMLDDDAMAVMARLRIAASMQPMFDGLWGGPGGMYERRLGPVRAASMNRIADLVGAGILVAFGSDAPVTALGPWAAIAAAIHHSVPGQRVSARAAFSAHTRAGWRAAGEPGTGVLAPGSPAHYAVWTADDVVVPAPGERAAASSSDPRSGTPGLPVVGGDAPLPACERTVVAGRVVHDSGLLA
ncbi:MAG: amidohydrolase [Candidatus Nanopelagicales bacterium]